MIEIKWIHCPICGSKIRAKIRANTVLKNYPLYCPKYRYAVVFYEELGYNYYSRFERSECYAKYKACV